MTALSINVCSPSLSIVEAEANARVRPFPESGIPDFRLQFTRGSCLEPRRVRVIRSGLGEGKKERPFVYARAKPEVRWPHKSDELNLQRIGRESENAGRASSRVLPDWEELVHSDAVVRDAEEGEEGVSGEGQPSLARRLEREEMIKKREAFRQRQKGQVRRLQSMSKLALRKATDLQNKARRLATAICLLESERPISDVLDEWPEQLNNDEMSAVVRNVGDKNWRRALEFYEWLNLRQWYTPNPRLLAIILHVLGRANQLEDALELFLKADPELTSCIQVFNAILGVYAKQGQWQAAEHILELIALRGCEPDIITFNTIANARCKNGLQPGMASALLREIENAGLRPDIVTYNTLLGGCIAMKYITEASDIVKEMEQREFDLNACTSYVSGKNCLVVDEGERMVLSALDETSQRQAPSVNDVQDFHADDPHQISILDRYSSDATCRPEDESVICLFMQWKTVHVMSPVVQCTPSLRCGLVLGSKRLGSRKFRPCRIHTSGWILGDVYHIITTKPYKQLHLCMAAQAPDADQSTRTNYMLSDGEKLDGDLIQVATQRSKEELVEIMDALSYTRLMNECMIKKDYVSGLEQLTKMVSAGMEPGYMTWISVLQACGQCANRIDLLRLLAALRDAGCPLPLRLILEREAAMLEVENWLRNLQATAADAGQGMVNVLLDMLWAFKLRATAGHLYDLAAHLDIYPRNFAKVEEQNWEADFRNLSPGTVLVALNHWFIEMQKASLDGFPEPPKEVLMITGTQGYQNGVSLNKTIRAHLWEMGSPFYMRPPREGALIAKGHAVRLWLKDSPRCFNLELADSMIIPKVNSMRFFKGAWMSSDAVPVMTQIHTSIGEVWPRKYSKLAHMSETRRIEALAARIENEKQRRLEKRDKPTKKKKRPLRRKKY